MKELFSNPTCRWCAGGGFFRFFGGYSIGFFLPKYFSLVYPEKVKVYSVGYAFCVSLMGFLSSILGGYVSDKYEKEGILMTKAYVCLGSALAGTLCFALCTLIQSSFWFSLIMIALEYFCAENWIAPVITMMLNTVSPENKGAIVSVFLFSSTIGGTIGTALAQAMFNQFEAKDHPERTGYILCAFVAFSYLGSMPFFFAAGRNYKAVKEE